MGLFSWCYRKGIVGAISKDIVTKYLAIKRIHPSEDEKKILLRLWDLWLAVHEKPIRSKDGAKKTMRLDLMKEEIIPQEKSELASIFSENRLASLVGIFGAVLFIENDIGPSDGKIFIDCIKVFVKEAKEYGLDYTQELESMEWTMKLMGIK